MKFVLGLFNLATAQDYFNGADYNADDYQPADLTTLYPSTVPSVTVTNEQFCSSQKASY